MRIVTAAFLLLHLGCSSDGLDPEPEPEPEPDPEPELPFWGEAPDLEIRLAIFDELDADLTATWVFAASDIDWEVARPALRQRIEKARTYGEFYKVLSDVFLDLRDFHNVLHSSKVCDTPIADRPPFFRGLYSEVGYGPQAFGFCGTALPDDSVLVYKTDPTNPAGLRPGDQIVGFDGTSLRELLDVAVEKLPMCGAQAGHPGSQDGLLLAAVPYNAHLYQEIDILRFDTQTIESVATEGLLESSFPELICTDQLATGVPFPWNQASDPGQTSSVSSGILPGTNIGYIYLYDWQGDAGTAFLQAVTDLMDTDGLIIDSRLNFGGNLFLSFDTLRVLFEEDIRGVFFIGSRANPRDLQLMSILTSPYQVLVDPATVYDRPIAILTGPSAISSGDDVAYMLASHPRARRFGRATNGSGCFNPSTGTLWDPDPHLSDIKVIRTPCVSLDRDKQPFSGPGIEPEVDVWLTPEDVVADRDTVVESALAWIAAENETP